MAYVSTAWTNGTTPLNATNLNHLETQYLEAANTLNHEFIQPFIEFGLVCTRDGTTLNQLDVTAGVGWLNQASDASRRERVTVASTPGQFTTSTPSTTYYLFLNSDGTFTWGTTSTGPTNSLAICQATTDGSGNILAVTDVRPLTTTLFQNMAANLGIPMGLLFGTAVSGSQGLLTFDSVNHTGVMWTPQAGATALGFAFKSWTGSTTGSPFSVGGQFGGAASYVDNAGAIHLGGAVGHVAGVATAGNFGVGAIVAQALDVNVTATTLQTILNYSVTATGIYRVNAHFSHGNTGTTNVTMQAQYTDPHLSTVAITFADSNGLFGIFAHGYAQNVSVSTLPMVMQCKTGTTVQVVYTDASGTPSDFVSVVLERLA